MNRSCNSIILIFLILLILPLIGCATSSLLDRTAQLHELPNEACIRTVLHEIPAISSIKNQHFDLSYFQYDYTYEVEGRLVTLTIWEDDTGVFGLSHWHYKKFGRFFKEEIIKIKRVMLEVERQLETTCAIEGLQANIIEFCEFNDCNIDD